MYILIDFNHVERSQIPFTNCVSWKLNLNEIELGFSLIFFFAEILKTFSRLQGKGRNWEGLKWWDVDEVINRAGWTEQHRTKQNEQLKTLKFLFLLNDNQNRTNSCLVQIKRNKTEQNDLKMNRTERNQKN